MSKRNGISGRIHRDRSNIYYDILTTLGKEGNSRIGKLCRIANLSHYAMRECLQHLETHGLVTASTLQVRTPKSENAKEWILTPRGIDYCNTVEKLEQMLPVLIR